MGTTAVAAGEVGALPERKLCQECKKAEWRYKCPRCEFRSCALACVKAHKDRTGCDGKRDRTAFVPLAEFCDNVLVSGEQQFLEVFSCCWEFPASKVCFWFVRFYDFIVHVHADDRCSLVF